MRKGIRFQIPNKHGKQIADILEPVNCLKYVWKIEDNQIWVSDNLFFDSPLFLEECIEGSEFHRLISYNHYYVNFITLKAFLNHVDQNKICSYEDFVDSECDLIILIADCIFVDIYCKSNKLIDELYKNAKNKRYEKIEYINVEDNRTRMDVR